MICRVHFKSALKYVFHNSFVLHQCYEIVNRVRNEPQKERVVKEGGFEGNLALMLR